MNEDLFQSAMDDDLFDDNPGGGTQQQTTVTPAGGGGTMGGAVPPTTNTPPVDMGGTQQQQQQQKGDDNDIMSRLNGMVSGAGGGSHIEDGDDVLTAYLKKNGMNPDAIEIQDENGQSQLVSFSDLSKAEQLDMISSLSAPNNNDNGNDYDLDNEEVDLLNSIRKSNMNVQDFIAAVREQAVSEYINSGGGEKYYSVDELNDDDLFLSDYKHRVPNATEEEAMAALETSKSNPQVFQRTMQGMRENYKQQEEQIEQARIEQQEREAEAQYQQYEQMIVSAVDKMSKFQLGEINVSLSADDKNDIASTILDKDVTGTRYLAQLINDPEKLSKMVWFATKGEEGINQMQRYYRKEIADKQSAAYRKGFEDAKSGKNMSFSVQRPKSQQQTQQRNQGFQTIGRVEDIDAGIY